MIVYVKTPNKGTLNMRTAPNGSVLIKIPNGTKLDAEIENDWAKVTYQEKTGYVKTDFLSTSKITQDDLKKIYTSLKETLTLIEKVIQ